MKTLEVLNESDVTFNEVKKRFSDNVSKFGELDPLSDPRDWIEESLEELYDAINYLTFLTIKLRKLRENGIRDTARMS